jgi:hypothetical protein
MAIFLLVKLSSKVQSIKKLDNSSGFRMQNGGQSIRKPDSKTVRKMTIQKLDGPDLGC